MLLRCAGCGQEVSEWAARCRACGHGTADAALVAPVPVPPEAPGPAPADAAPAQIASTGPTAPADLAGHGWRAWLAVGAATAAVIAGGTLLGLHLAGPSRTPASGTRFGLPRSASGGRLVAQNPQGTLVLTDPDGGRVVALSSFGSFGGEVVVPALDRRYLATLQGAVLAVDNVDGVDQTGVTALTDAAPLGGPDTFADGDQALVLVKSSEQPLHTGAISTLTLADQHTVSLGVADEAAGDPAAVGVFVSVPALRTSFRAADGAFVGLPDSRVELRDQGQRPLVLATAGQLNADLGQDPGRPVHLSVFPDPDGDTVAVVLNPPAGGESNVGVVLLDRRGQLLAVIRPSSGPTEYSWPSWSPDGRALAYPSHGVRGSALVVWTEGGHVLARTAPDNGAGFGYCVWAPDGSAFVCPTFESAQARWDLGATRGGPLSSVAAPGNPIVWLPGAGG
ncbi:MAG TPA: hypothetical protein VGL49_07145 [Acidimicrobiales bacterium]